MSEFREVTPRDADKVVRHMTNPKYNSALFPSEVAEEFDVSVEMAYELLSGVQSPFLRRRYVDIDVREIIHRSISSSSLNTKLIFYL